MGVEEQVGEVAGKSVDVMRERPLMFGMLLLMACFLGFSAWQQHDASIQNQNLTLKLLEFRHTELMALLNRLKQEEEAITKNPPQASPYVQEP